MSRRVAVVGAGMSQFGDLKRTAKSRFAEAFLEALDVDVAEVHDCFTIAEILAVAHNVGGSGATCAVHVFGR